MNDISSITSLIRSIIDDEEKDCQDIYVASGSSDVFTLSESNINSIDSVLINDTESNVTYIEDLSHSKIRITSNLIIDDVVEFNYKAYTKYSNKEILANLKTALVHISINNIKQFSYDATNIYPTPENREANLIALITSILINPGNISYRIPEFSVSVPDDLNTFDKIRKVMSIYKKSSGSDYIFIADDNKDLNKGL